MTSTHKDYEHHITELEEMLQNERGKLMNARRDLENLKASYAQYLDYCGIAKEAKKHMREAAERQRTRSPVSRTEYTFATVTPAGEEGDTWTMKGAWAVFGWENGSGAPRITFATIPKDLEKPMRLWLSTQGNILETRDIVESIVLSDIMGYDPEGVLKEVLSAHLSQEEIDAQATEGERQ